MEKNKMAVVPLKKLFWKMGLPMIISMVLQALYNVIDSIFITNMGSDGVIANQALTLAFPVQLLIIAIGVGTGVGINALLSKSLGEQNKDKVNKQILNDWLAKKKKKENNSDNSLIIDDEAYWKKLKLYYYNLRDKVFLNPTLTDVKDELTEQHIISVSFKRTQLVEDLKQVRTTCSVGKRR